MGPRHISSSRAHSDKIPTATPMFSGSSFLVVVLKILWHIDVLEVQDGSQTTRSTNHFAGFTDTHVVPKTVQGFMTVRNI